MKAFVTELMDLSGQVAVLTGAAGGVGRATALTLGAAGADLVLGDIDTAGLQATGEMLKPSGRRVALVATDVSRKADVEALVGRASEEFGRLDIMGNIAAVPQFMRILKMTEDDLEKVLNVNLKGVFYGCQAALRTMVAQRSGCIVNFAASGIDGAVAGLAGYGMAKAGVAMLTKVVAMEGAPYGVRANTIAPGWMDTPMTRAASGWETEEEHQRVLSEWAARVPLRRAGKPEDAAQTFLFLCSRASNWMTGQILRPNGGSDMPW
jgi:3-oxoacyl-[acyl-carrier protein] reductase